MSSRAVEGAMATGRGDRRRGFSPGFVLCPVSAPQRSAAAIHVAPRTFQRRRVRLQGTPGLTQMVAGLVLNTIVRSLSKGQTMAQSTPQPREGPTPSAKASSGVIRRLRNRDTATCLLILVNLLCFGLEHYFQLPEMSSLVLRTSDFRWWQLATSLCCHSDWQHLSSNLFLMFFFGRLIEEEEGGIALVFIFAFCGIVSNAVCLFLATKSTILLGSSGGVFGLFAASVLLRFRFTWKRLVEFFVIGNFVWATTVTEVGAVGASAAKRFGGAQAAQMIRVNHFGHLVGALAGVIVVILLRSVFRRKQQAS